MHRKEFAKALQQPVADRRAIPALQRNVLRHILLNSPNIRDEKFKFFSSTDLGHVFYTTDEFFFGGNLSRYVESNYSTPITFRLSKRMTTSGGMTTMSRDYGAESSETRFEIAVATTPLFETFSCESESKVGGLRCVSRLEALQRIVEHEMVHLVELLLTGDSNCQATPFRRFIKNWFGHRESNHQLLTPSDIARKELGIRCGDQVVFRVRGVKHQGVVNRITKRATVLVEDADGEPYTNGVSYRKFYVPLTDLRKTVAPRA